VLEDTWTDILQKAVRGRGRPECSLAPDRIQALLAGEKNETDLRTLAAALHLQPDRLLAISRGQYRPQPGPLPENLMRFRTDFDGMWVNSYLIWDVSTQRAAAFDTGADATELLDFLKKRNLQLDLLLLTHAHGDHIFELDRIVEKTGAITWIAESIEGARTFAPGKTFSIGSLSVETRLTNGHSPTGITYVVHGLSRCVAVVGDALFAGSIGGANVSYNEALRACASQILTLPEETLLCPGHGPLTTVGQEKTSNPFF
jgi:hydroxyacylglutathione hydrolase